MSAAFEGDGAAPSTARSAASQTPARPRRQRVGGATNPLRVAGSLMLALAWWGAGCAPPVTTGEATTPAAPTAEAPVSGADAGASRRVRYRGLDAQGATDGDALLARLSRRRVVCLGERHPVALDHRVQAAVIRRLSVSSRRRGEPFAVGFEMFQLPAQSVLERYADDRASEAELLSQSDYDARWGFDFELYRPVLEAAKAGDASLLALNAPREWTRAVARQGLEQLNPELRERLPELVLDDAEHRRFFEAAMAHHPHGSHGSPATSERFYAAQVLWDETMAERAAAWLRRAGDEARLVIIAGAGHCHRSAIPRRLARRLGEPVLSVRILGAGDLRQSDAPADTEFDLLLIAEPVASVAAPAVDATE